MKLDFESMKEDEIVKIVLGSKITPFAIIEEDGKKEVIGKPPLKVELLIIQKMTNLKKSQMEIAEVLGVKQSHISKRLKLFNLIPRLFNRVLEGTLAVSTARELASLPKEEQEKVKDISHKEACDLKKKFKGRNAQDQGEKNGNNNPK